MKKKQLHQFSIKKVTIANLKGGNSQQGGALPVNTDNTCTNPEPIHTQGCYSNQICPVEPIKEHTLKPIPVDPSDASDCFCYP
ncbi:hypothetical protein C8N46_11110 [Kordia periserrulae]|uniref:Uncharacterized protein n=1 Tax=Kordia periserrulae TaxID=701523 RepID=A0A2T6BS82_9FLAO|nr:hypothetical protein [Kordia periserrulae]PTX58941.1 hypothetical protein C8N46_11110 [Kordia periserrulae]